MKELIAGLFVFVLLFSFVGAQTADAELEEKDFSKENLKEKSNEFLDKDVQIPKNLQTPSKLIFGFKADNPIRFDLLVITIAFWVILLIILGGILEIFFENKFLKWMAAFAAASLAAASGGLYQGVIFIYHFLGIINLFNNYAIVKLIIALVIIVALSFFAYKFFKTLMAQSRLQENEVAGVKTGVSSAQPRKRP